MELPARLTAPRLDKLSSGNTSSSTSRELVNGDANELLPPSCDWSGPVGGAATLARPHGCGRWRHRHSAGEGPPETKDEAW